jgi:hypothetical protein
MGWPKCSQGAFGRRLMLGIQAVQKNAGTATEKADNDVSICP